MNKQGLFECHVTIAKPEDLIKYEMFGIDNQWKTSYIIGDPLLGKEGFFYFTCHHSEYESIFSKMEHLAARLDVPVLRKKIEQIVYDTKRLE